MAHIDRAESETGGGLPTYHCAVPLVGRHCRNQIPINILVSLNWGYMAWGPRLAGIIADIMLPDFHFGYVPHMHLEITFKIA